MVIISTVLYCMAQLREKYELLLESWSKPGHMELSNDFEEDAKIIGNLLAIQYVNYHAVYASVTLTLSM